MGNHIPFNGGNVVMIGLIAVGAVVFVIAGLHVGRNIGPKFTRDLSEGGLRLLTPAA